VSPSSSSRPSPFRGRWLPVTIGVILLTLLFLTLGFWQLNRLAQRRAANALLLARISLPPLVIEGATLDPEADSLRRAVVHGVFDQAQEILLRNRTYNELPGVHVLTPLRIAGSEAAILVDRGWIPYEVSGPGHRAVFSGPEGQVEVQGILGRSQTRSSNFSPADPPLGPARLRLDAWHRVDLSRIQEQIPYPLLPLYLEQEGPPAPTGEAAARFPRPAPEVELSEGSHLFYAIQWFAFAGILAGGYGFFLRSKRSQTGT
jgi:surfeit locus 1 family protein